jgi:hypothetical protein
VFFWFVSTAVLTVWFVFRDPRFDYRLLIVGSVLPDLDGLFGGAGVMHSVLFSVLLLAAVMVGTAGRKPVRRLLLGLPIGTFLHLVFDGAWTDTHVFWWPFGGTDLGDAPLPSVGRGAWSLLLEAIGVALSVWIWRRAQLGGRSRRAAFWHEGRLDLAVGASPRGGVVD